MNDRKDNKKHANGMSWKKKRQKKGRNKDKRKKERKEQEKKSALTGIICPQTPTGSWRT